MSDRPNACHPYILRRLDIDAPYVPHTNSSDAKQRAELVLHVIREFDAEVGLIVARANVYNMPPAMTYIMAEEDHITL